MRCSPNETAYCTGFANGAASPNRSTNSRQRNRLSANHIPCRSMHRIGWKIAMPSVTASASAHLSTCNCKSDWKRLLRAGVRSCRQRVSMTLRQSLWRWKAARWSPIAATATWTVCARASGSTSPVYRVRRAAFSNRCSTAPPCRRERFCPIRCCPTCRPISAALRPRTSTEHSPVPCRLTRRFRSRSMCRMSICSKSMDRCALPNCWKMQGCCRSTRRTTVTVCRSY